VKAGTRLCRFHQQELAEDCERDDIHHISAESHRISPERSQLSINAVREKLPYTFLPLHVSISWSIPGVNRLECVATYSNRLVTDATAAPAFLQSVGWIVDDLATTSQLHCVVPEVDKECDFERVGTESLLQTVASRWQTFVASRNDHGRIWDVASNTGRRLRRMYSCQRYLCTDVRGIGGDPSSNQIQGQERW